MAKAFKSLDLSSVFKREKPVVVPEIMGVITMKSESLKTQIANAGFKVEKAEEMQDGSVVFAQADDVSGESTLVRISEDAVLAVKGLKPYMMDVTLEDGTSFEDVCKASGFVPGLGSSIDLLRGTVLSLAEKSEDPEATILVVQKMFDEVSAYAASLIKDLPASAFRLEYLESDDAVVKAAPQSADSEGTPVEPSAPVVAAVIKSDASDGDEEAFKACAGCKTPDVCLKAQACSASSATKQDEVATPDAALLAVTALTAKMDSLMNTFTSALSGMGETVSGLSDKIASVEAVAKAAREAVEGTVVSGGGSDDRSQTRKSDVRPAGREIDTAFVDVRRRR